MSEKIIYKEGYKLQKSLQICSNDIDTSNARSHKHMCGVFTNDVIILGEEGLEKMTQDDGGESVGLKMTSICI